MTNQDIYDLKKALPNKFLNPDGTISTLQELIGGGVSADLFIVVQQLPNTGEPNKIYLVPNQNNSFDEYFWDGSKWDKIGEMSIDPNNYYTKDQTNSNFLKKDNTTAYTPSADYNPATKKYVDDTISASVTNMLTGNY